MDNKKCCCTSNGLLLPTTINIHLMDNKNCCCTSNLLPENVLVEKGGYYSPNSVIQDIMAFSHVLLKHEFFMPSYQWKRLFLHFYGVFWRLTIHRPQTSHKQHTKEENKRGSGVYVSPSERSRYSSKYIISLDELIVWMLYIAWRSVHGCQFSSVVSHCTFSEYILYSVQSTAFTYWPRV